MFALYFTEGDVMQNKSNKALKWIVVLAIGLIIATVVIRYSAVKSPNKVSHSPIASEQQPDSEKKKRWQAMEKEVASWGDALGLGIDPGIKNTVIVLNLLGFKTSQSCEGHMDRGLAYPWIDFETENQEMVILNNKRQDIVKRIEEKHSEIQKKYPDLSLGEALRKGESEELDAIYPELHAINDKMEKLAKAQLVPLKNLLADFYKNRSIDPDKMITIRERMYSLGGDWQITRNDNEKAKKLKEYQNEMNSLADFLTDYYFGK